MTRSAHSFRTSALLGWGLLFASAALAGGPPTSAEPSAPAEPSVAAEPSSSAAEPSSSAAEPTTAEDATPPIDMKADWPCVQHKVETVSVSQIWDGPAIDGIKGWYKDKDLTGLIELLASRRVPVTEAETAIKKFADAQPEGERDAKLTMLFAGLFDTVLSQRRSVLSGIEKYQKSQKQRARELEVQSTEIAKLESQQAANGGSPNDISESGTALSGSPELDQARERFNWAQRIFQDRQQNIPLACELPVLIEERLYSVAHSIRSLMKS